MLAWSDLRMYGRFGFGLRRFLRDTISLDAARQLIRTQQAQREQNFLRIVRKGIFDHPKSPYLPLLRLADVGYPDIEGLVKDRGVEGALRALRDADVYVSFEECKGRQPIVRGGHEYPVTERDFDNPWLEPIYQAESGGSTGAGTRVHHELGHLADVAPYEMVTYHANGVLDAPMGLWRGVLPDGSGINNVLRAARYGRYFRRWFSHTLPQDYRGAMLKFRVASQLTLSMARLYGAPLPWPERVRLDEAIVVARWMRETVDRNGACMLSVAASRALRVTVAALDAGISLDGATFRVAGEPLSAAKQEGIERSGARVFATYGFSEVGRIGMGCARPLEPNDLHLARGICALIQHDRVVPTSTATVPAFCFTSLLPSAPKILLNAESDDYGIVETRRCGCPLEELGLVDHLRRVRSFRKVTGEGITLVGTDAVYVLEEVLPATFGGTALDYQMQEEEDADGFTRLNLVISPRVVIDDEERVVQVVLDALQKRHPGADQAQSVWRQAGTLRVRRGEPQWTARGKFFSLRSSRPSPPS